MRILLAAAAVFVVTTAQAQTIYPLDRADILAGAKFDFKVEFPDQIAVGSFKVTMNDVEPDMVFGRPAKFIEQEAGVDRP